MKKMKMKLVALLSVLMMSTGVGVTQAFADDSSGWWSEGGQYLYFDSGTTDGSDVITGLDPYHSNTFKVTVDKIYPSDATKQGAILEIYIYEDDNGTVSVTGDQLIRTIYMSPTEATGPTSYQTSLAGYAGDGTNNLTEVQVVYHWNFSAYSKYVSYWY